MFSTGKSMLLKNMDGWMDGWKDRGMDRRMDEWMKVWMGDVWVGG